MGDSPVIVLCRAAPAIQSEYGARRLEAALARRGWEVRREPIERLPHSGCALAFIANDARAGDEPPWLRAARRRGLQQPPNPEGLSVWPLPGDAALPPLVLLTGGERGLMYALLEAARRVELGGASPASGADAAERLLALFPASTETPERDHRSVCIFPHHPELDAEWFRSLEFWEWYFDLLALHRFNHFSLIFGHQTAYFAPPYPFFVAVPEYPEVTVPALEAAQREGNLDLLRGISDLAVERGLDFTLGVWQQHAYTYGETSVTGLQSGNIAGYCAAGLRRLLEACPNVSGLQLRVNHESGVQLHEGPAFWRTVFASVRECGRPIRLDLRAKAIVDDTVRAALATGLPVSVSTKFWGEHQGLPYHASLLPDEDRYVRRHSYGDQLRAPRDFDLIFQLWNLGTNKLLLWGDPAWVRQFAASTTLGGARGFEVCAPLSNKGFRGRGGVWRIFADPSYEHYRWEQERYWYWYTLFGRLGYSGQCSPESWQREWDARLGAATGRSVVEALRHASGILPLVTAAHSPSAGSWTYWPEKDMGGVIDLYAQVEPGDMAFFSSAEAAVDERLQGAPTARMAPRDTAAVLDVLASSAMGALASALDRGAPDGPGGAERRGVALDVGVQVQLGRYHAAKLRAAEHLVTYYRTQDLHCLDQARGELEGARAAWRDLAALTRRKYQDDLTFGTPGVQQGHWKDHLPYADYDLARVDALANLARRFGIFDRGFDFGAALGPRSGSPALPYLEDYACERGFVAASPQSMYARDVGWGWSKIAGKGVTAVAAPATASTSLHASAPLPRDLPREPLYCDFVKRNPATSYDNAAFLVDLPDGEYEVVIVLCDRSAAPAGHGPMTLSLQGYVHEGPLVIPAGEIVEIRRRVAVASGRLELLLNAEPEHDWILTGLVITRVQPHVGHAPPPRARPGEPLTLCATVTSPEPVARCTVWYRFGAQGPFASCPLRPADEAARDNPRRQASIDVPDDASRVEYFIEAEDKRGARVTWPAGGADAARVAPAGRETSPPEIRHEPLRRLAPGVAQTIRSTVQGAAPLARVTLHYRHVNQMQTTNRVAMGCTGAAPGGAGGGTAGTYEASIPAAFVRPEWDVMYYIEAVDVLGNASFFPGLAAGTPYIVAGVECR